MVFSELYSVYYNAVANILAAAFQPGVTEQQLRQCVMEQAFSESALTILPALKSGRWPLLREDFTPLLRHTPTMPLTTLEKRWLKGILEDPRIRLFEVEVPGLEGVEPLFTREDYRIYDQYADGDPFEDEGYIRHFQMLLTAIREEKAVKVRMKNRHGRLLKLHFCPKRLEYSLKDDRIRVIATGGKYSTFNVARIVSCEFYYGTCREHPAPKPEVRKDLTLQITDERKALERAMLHFAHFEKRAERVGEKGYLLHLKYYESDETELVIRILSFGPLVRAVAPDSFVELIRQRLKGQKICGLK